MLGRRCCLGSCRREQLNLVCGLDFCHREIVLRHCSIECCQLVQHCRLFARVADRMCCPELEPGFEAPDFDLEDSNRCRVIPGILHATGQDTCNCGLVLGYLCKHPAFIQSHLIQLSAHGLEVMLANGSRFYRGISFGLCGLPRGNPPLHR